MGPCKVLCILLTTMNLTNIKSEKNCIPKGYAMLVIGGSFPPHLD